MISASGWRAALDYAIALRRAGAGANEGMCKVERRFELNETQRSNLRRAVWGSK